jgi:hypothetical protein
VSFEFEELRRPVLEISVNILHGRSLYIAKHDDGKVCTVPTIKFAYTLLFRLFGQLLSSFIEARIKAITIDDILSPLELLCWYSQLSTQKSFYLPLKCCVHIRAQGLYIK